MRERIKYLLAALSMGLMLWVMYLIAFVLPSEGIVAAYQNLYIHVPAFGVCFTGFFLGLVASGMYLATGDFRYDSFAAGVNEVALVFGTAGIVMGSIWARLDWGIWWTWDARLTSTLVCLLLYYGYLLLRQSVEEPSTRARLSAALSILGCMNALFVYKSIDWYRTQHPSAVLSFRTGGGHIGPGMEYPLLISWIGMVCLGVLLAMVRMEQGEISREIDSVRRQAHSY